MRLIAFKVSCLVLLLVLLSSAKAEDRFEHPPILYSKSTPKNPVSQLQDKLEQNKLNWKPEKHTGHLRSLLKALKIDIDSQTLNFAKTSLQGRLISPGRPRALFFNDDIYVGYVNGSQLLELSVADPAMGAVFYTFNQDTRRLKREVGDCMLCHGSSRTGYQPGHVIRSVYPATDGQPIFRAGSHTISHNSPYENRWGGWYVSGEHGTLRHMGNAIAEITEDDDIDINREREANTLDLEKYFETNRYLSPHSDIVAVIVQDHQKPMHNLLAAANYNTRYALYDQKIIDKALKLNSSELRESTLRRIASAGEKVVRYMLFTEEPPLPDKVSGTTQFAKKFSARGPHDRKGRSLYQLDLKTRLMKYPCSYLIYSDSFDQLPSQMKTYVYRRLWEVLSGQEKSKPYDRINAESRQAILEILLETKTDLPDYWKKAKR